MAFPSLPTTIACPSCQHRFVAQVRSIIDVGQEPELKQQLLSGELNLVSCPKCGGGGLLSTPLVYHDPSKELLVALIPHELGMSADEQEQLVGSLVNAVMNSVPAEERKSYFLQPRTVLRYESLLEAILEAEGISREMIEEQRATMRLIDELTDALDDDEALDKLVDDHRSDLDYEFFLLLSEMIDTYGQRVDSEPEIEEQVQSLRDLREALLERVNPAVASPSANTDDVIDLFLETEDEARLARLVSTHRQRLDYGFFQRLTARIEEAEGRGDEEAAEQLTSLRERILDAIDEQNELLRRNQDRANLLAMRLAAADDIPAALRANRDRIDEVFIAVVSRLAATALDDDDHDLAERLQSILDATLEMVEEALPPQDRLLNRLLRADYPDDTNAILEQHRGQINEGLLAKVDDVLESLDEDDAQELADHLRQVRGQIEAKLTILRA